MLALCSMLSGTYYAKNYAGIIGRGLNIIVQFGQVNAYPNGIWPFLWCHQNRCTPLSDFCDQHDDSLFLKQLQLLLQLLSVSKRYCSWGFYTKWYRILHQWYCKLLSLHHCHLPPEYLWEFLSFIWLGSSCLTLVTFSYCDVISIPGVCISCGYCDGNMANSLVVLHDISAPDTPG